MRNLAVVTDPVFFRDLAYVLVAAVAGGAVARLARQPLILGYVLGGILISPLTPGPSVSDLHTFELFAEIGVILLMFSVGIEFSLRDLLRVKWVALLGGPLGIVLSVGLGLGVGTLLGWPPLQGAIVGIVVSVASTMVLARLLMDRGELHSRHGRIMIGITLVEDLAVVVLIVLIPALGSLEPGRLLTIALALGKSLLILVPTIYLAAKGIPPLMTRVARWQSDEMFLLVALAIGLGTAALSQAAGLSLALGAFLAGLIISSSDHAHETLARLLPLRDVFVALFFVTIGALIDPGRLLANVPLLATMVAMVVIGKLALWALVVRLFRQPFWTALLVGVGLTQIGEFSFILVQVARTAGHVGADVYNATLAASLVTILVNAALVRTVPGWIAQARGVEPRPPASIDPEPVGHVILCGFGRVGSAVGEALETFGIRFVVIERDPDVVRGLRSRAVPCLFGDAAQGRLLEEAGTARAALVVVSLPENDRAAHVVRNVRARNPRAPILARAHGAAARAGLTRAGATEIIEPELEAAATLIRHALRELALPPDEVLDYLARFRGAMGAVTAGGPGGPPTDHPLPEVREITLATGALADLTLGEARVRERFGVTVVAVERRSGETLLNPSADTVLRARDRLRVFGLPEQIDAFRLETERAP
ncbi:MAG TPA: cation:proton antiporter [Candidatus Dormibacteraeota bacterium]|jgi:CPA2 family monovalent cation:H+ antiporter-2|nr:cation:proton antiporter [Candidatus Dormibacteraeota bacterium]